MSGLSDELMNLKFLVTEANLLEYGLLRRGQRISPINLVGFRDTPGSRLEAEEHIARVSSMAERLFLAKQRAQRIESIKEVRALQRSEDARASERLPSTGAGPSSQTEGKTPFTLHYAPRLGDKSLRGARFTPTLWECGQISDRRWTWTEYADYLDLIDPFLSHPKRRRPRAGWIPLGDLAAMRATWFCEYDSNLYGEVGRMVSEFATSCLHPERSTGGSLEDYFLALIFACLSSIAFS